MNTVTLNLSGMNSLPVIRQNEASECGFACLAMIANYYGFKTDISVLRRKYTTSLQGMTLKSVIDLATKLNFSSRPLKVLLELLRQVRLPAIIHWDMNHFVVLKSISRKKLIIHDPARGEGNYTEEEFSKHFTGIVLELTPLDAFEKKKELNRFKLSDLWGRIYGIKRNLLQVLFLSILLQIFVLAGPFYLQIAVDEVLIRNDIDLLRVLALGFAGITVASFITQTLRSYVLLYFGSMLSFQMETNLFRHLIKLPVDFFEKRHIGDIVSRFGSMEPVRTLITESLIAGLIDGVMAITTFLMMFVYSPALAAIAFLAWVLYFCLRLFFYKPYRSAQEEVIVNDAQENTVFMETVRGITSLKLFGCENERAYIWQNRFAALINSNAKLGKLDIWFQSANYLIFGLEHIILIYLAISLSMAGSLSIGMIFAFMAYKQNFTEKASSLVEKVIEYRMLGLHLERISDIANTETENADTQTSHYVKQTPISGNFELSNIHFRYSSDSAEILSGVNLKVRAGESIAIVGTSGCGKTTLLKIMVSLFKPSSGDVLFDGMSSAEIGMTDFRKQLGVIMQEDDLFAGSIAENISFFDPEIKIENMISAAKTSMIHDEIMAMPMKYESHIGDMGSALSGGQKQRVMLARALYRQPRILFMDEGTAHLDTTTERIIGKLIANLGITRVLVAHRPETIQLADRVVELCRGQLKEIVFKGRDTDSMP